MEQTIGKRIAANRKRLGLTQEQLAEKLGITAQAVSKWENDQTCPDISALPMLADIFGISTDELLGRNQTPTVAQFRHDGYCHSDDDEDDEDDDDDDDDDDDIHIHINPDGEEHHEHKGKLHLLGLAALFLTVGVLFLLSKLLGWECSFWDILWPSSLLVFGVFGMIKNFSLFGLACAALGAFFLTSKLLPLPVDLDSGIIWAVIIIVCGVMLLLDALLKKRHRKVHIDNAPHSHEYRVADNYLHCSNSFGEENQLVIAQLLTGGKISNSFGEYKVDLSGVEAVSDNCTLEVSSSFGELELLVPKRYAVVRKSSKSFASFSVSGKADDVPVGQIFLKATVSFGELTIRYI